MLKDWFNKIKQSIKDKATSSMSKISKSSSKHTKRKSSQKSSNDQNTPPNRFLKFYYLNQKQLNEERRSSYNKRKKNGICVRCKKKSLPGIVFCEYHQHKQKEYNEKARAE